MPASSADPGPDDARTPSDVADERARRRARVFGDVLPEVTRDERSREDDPDPAGGGEDDWLRANVPPHHGA